MILLEYLRLRKIRRLRAKAAYYRGRMNAIAALVNAGECSLSAGRKYVRAWAKIEKLEERARQEEGN